MKIVVLDGFASNPGDLSWDGLRALGECAIHDRTPASQIVERLRDADIALTNKAPLDRPRIEALPRLRYIGVLATGYNVVDVKAAAERGVVVTNVPAYGTDSVAQLAFALLLELCQRVGDHARGVAQGKWTASQDFCYWDYPLVELAGLTMGIVGYGRIGQKVAHLARAFEMKVVVYTRTPPRHAPEGVRFASLDALFREADVVSLNCPLTPDTERLVNAERLAMMKPSAFLINTGRGPLVDEAALAHALNAGRLAGAGLDVLCKEPPPADNPLLTARNCLITPHLAWGTRAARARLTDVAVGNVKAFIEGRPRNVVS